MGYCKIYPNYESRNLKTLYIYLKKKRYLSKDTANPSENLLLKYFVIKKLLYFTINIQ